MISVVIPVYRSAGSLTELHQRILAVMSSIRDDDYEIILVDDGSDDQSWETICQLARIDMHVRGIRLARNYGQHNAILCGIRHARQDLIVIMDDDLQNPPEEIPKLLNELNKGFDVVYGKPAKEQHSLLRNWSSKLTKIVLKSIMGAETAEKVGPFKIFRTSLRNSFETFKAPYVNIDVLLTWGTVRFSGVTVEHSSRKTGSSNYTLSKLIAHAFNLMTGFSTVPLQVASIIGFFLAFFGFIVLIFVLINYLYEGRAVPGFAFLASLIAIFSGAQMFATGVIGEYLARIHFRTMDKPSYIAVDYTATS